MANERISSEIPMPESLLAPVREGGGQEAGLSADKVLVVPEGRATWPPRRERQNPM